MDERLDADAVAPIESQPHLESLQRSVRLKRQAQAPANDIAAVAVRQQRQVEETVTVPYIGDVCHSHFPAGLCHELGARIQQVLVDMEVVARVRRTGTVLPLAEHQPIGTQHIVEAVTADLELVAEILTAQGTQLAAAALRQPVLRPHPATVHHNARHKYAELRITLLMLVIAVSTDAK